MADQDEFEKLGPEWQRVYERYRDGGESYEVGDEILLTLPRVLRVIGGCQNFRALETVLQEYWADKYQSSGKRSLWDTAPTPFPKGKLNDLLDDLTRKTRDRRLDTVAIRSARIVACQLSSHEFLPAKSTELSNHLGACIIQDYICHRVLDMARAHAVGVRFLTFADSHAFHDEVLDYLGPALRKYGQQLALDPTGQFIRRVPRLIEKRTTASMLFDGENFQLDV